MGLFSKKSDDDKPHHQDIERSPSEMTAESRKWAGDDPYHNPRDDRRRDTYSQDGYMYRSDGSHSHFGVSDSQGNAIPDGDKKDFASRVVWPDDDQSS